MNIAVIGSGAMGSLFGALLAEAGEQVVLVDIRQDHVDAINAHGLAIETSGTERRLQIQATTDPTRMGTVDLCVIFVKSTHTQAAAQTAARLCTPTSRVLTLQNGMGNAETLAAALDPSRVIGGTTSHGATFVGPGAIRHAGIGETVIGPWSSAGAAGVDAVATIFNQAGIETRVASDIRRVMWAKLFINVGINAITALTGITNGQLLDLEQTRRLSRRAVEEAMAVAEAQGIAIEGDPVAKVFQVAQATGSNRSSMGQDLDNRRPTEIKAINGFVVRLAEQTGVSAPVNRTLTALVETAQAQF